jgi:hypothetical protein
VIVFILFYFVNLFRPDLGNLLMAQMISKIFAVGGGVCLKKIRERRGRDVQT